MKYLLANWKQNLSVDEIRNWIDVFVARISPSSFSNNRIIIAPTSLHLPILKGILEEKSLDEMIFLASQDVSMFENGSHTGEIGAFQLNEFVKYSIIGHSERRKLGENFEIINKKISQVIQNNISPIVCFSNKDEYFSILESEISSAIDPLFLFEPLFAIGTGNPATIEDVINVHKDYADTDILYGGSVDKTNIVNYLSTSFIKGFGVGTASLDPVQFADIANVI